MPSSPDANPPAVPIVRRPQLHFTATHGWINDPHGLRFVNGRYVLHFQSLPDQTVWSPEISWGTATSDDLLRWRQSDASLAPAPYEVGCWSGCVVTDDHGREFAFYTRVRTGALDRAQIAFARRAEQGLAWVTSEADVVVDGPPDESVIAFRDPFVWRDGQGWLMIIGAGLAHGEGAVLAYRSTDLMDWDYVGVFAQGRVLGDSDVVAEIWECPQLVHYGDRAVLIISILRDGQGQSVAACVGGIVGARFSPGAWSRLIHGPHAYATSVFRDRDGRPCMMSWLRDVQDLGRPQKWVGALSLPSTLSLIGDAISVGLAEQVSEGLRVVEVAGQGGVLRTSSPGDAYRVRLCGDVSVTVTDAEETAPLRVAQQGSVVAVTAAGQKPETFETASAATLELVIDGGIVELFAGGSYGVWNCTPRS